MSNSNATGDFRINVYNVGPAQLVASDFSFVVHRSGAYVPPAPPARMIAKYGDTENWAMADPDGFESCRQAVQKAERDSMRVVKTTVPYDEAEPSGQISQGAIRPKR